jgi:uncharacterized protein YcfJ
MRITLFILAALLLLPMQASAGTGSGDEYRPAVQGTMGTKYNKDVRACQRRARDKSSKGTDIAIGAGAGAVGGGILGAIGGNTGIGALAGAAAGGVGGHLSDEGDREQFVKDCMEDKGYTLAE